MKMDDDEYAVLRLKHGELLDMKAKDWDSYKARTPRTHAVEVCRGLTISEAMNLTMLANEQTRMETK